MYTEKNSNLNYLQVKNSDAKTAIILLHGYGASMNDLYGLHDLIIPNFTTDWYFPDGILTVPIGPMMEGRAWFPIDMMELERAIQSGTHRSFSDKIPEGLEIALQTLETFIESIQNNYDQIILGGFSQGAMLSSHLSAKFKKIKGIVLFSSTLVAEDLLEKELEKSVSKPFFQSHGKQDPLLNYAEAKKLFELYKLFGNVGEFVPFEGGHEIPMPVIHKLNQWLRQLDLN